MSFERDRLAFVAGKELQRLLEISSVSGEEREMLAYLEKRCRAMGLHTRHQPVAGAGHNLLVNPLPEPGLIITAHTDTVPEVINGNGCRYEIVGERYYGRGAADAKGGIAALLAAMHELFEKGDLGTKDLPPVTFAFTVDEEQEGRGSEELARLGGSAAVVIEPTDLKVCIAQSGSVTVHLRVYGRSAHGGEYECGENAVFRAIELLDRLKRLPALNRQHPLIGEGGYNLQMIKGGGTEMAVPGQCELILDFRVLPGQEPEEVQNAVDNLLSEYGGVESKWVDVSGSYEIDKDEPVVSLMRACFREALGEEPCLGGIRSWTDGENLFCSGKRPVVFGPGNLPVSHTEEEYIELPEVVKAAGVLACLITGARWLKEN